MSGDIDVFDSFEQMETQEQPITLSDDSFDDPKVSNQYQNDFDKQAAIEKYRELKETSKKLDELAVEVRRLVTICKQMEECYSKRIGKDTVASCAELRHLHDGTSLLLITITNVTNQPMIDWILDIHPSPIFPTPSTSSSQTIALGNLPSGIRKTFECHVTFPAELPVILELGLIREFQLDEDVSKVFHVALDPICVTVWDQVQIGKGELNTHFTYTIRLPNILVDLLSGCPDTAVTPSQVIKAILNLDVTTPEVTLILLTSPAPTTAHLKCSKDSGTTHQVTIGAESSRSQKLLTEHLRLRLIVEMAKLKSRPAKGINVMGNLEESSIEQLFLDMLGLFH